MRISTHPGTILHHEFMVPLGLTPTALAGAMGVPPSRIRRIIAATAPRPVTPAMALLLARYFGTTPEFWMNLQTAYERSLV
jgi:addiction module HigA family antidote